MEAAGAAAKFRALDAELSAKSSRVAELEARVSLLEAENARLREALARGEATGRTGAGDPKSRRLAAGLRGSKHEEAEKLGGGAARDVIELRDYEEGPAAVVDANKGQSLEVQEEGVVAIAAPTRRNQVVTSESEDEADAEGAEGDGGSSMEDGAAGLQDEDVSVTPRGKRRAPAARVVTSDSEDEDVDGGELGSGKDDADDQEGVNVKPGRKRGLCGISGSDDEDVTEGVRAVASKDSARAVAARIESDDEDDTVPICQVLKKMRKQRVSGDGADDGLPAEASGRSTPTTRRSARLVKNQSKGGRASQSHLVNKFVESKEYEGSEDDMEEDDDTDGFINDSSSESASGSAEESHDVSGTSVCNEESSPVPEESDPVADYAGVVARIGRKKKANEWKFEADMLAAFAEHPELCLKAVCALYRKQTEEEQSEKAALVHNKQGFSHIDAHWGSCIAEFLLDGDRDGPLKKTIHDLEEHDSNALGFCRRVASNYSKQLFAIYQNKEDPDFHP